MGREMVDTRKESEAMREMQGDAETLREKQKTDGRGDTETENLAGPERGPGRGRRKPGISPRPPGSWERGRGVVPIDSAPGRGPDPPPFTPRRDAASAHLGSERAAPIPVCSRLLLPRRGLHSDGERRALWTLPRGLHWQWLALHRRQRGALAPHRPP